MLTVRLSLILERIMVVVVVAV